MNKIGFAIFFLLCVILSSCEYNTDDVYFVETTPPEQGEISLNLANIPVGTTIYVYKKMRLSFSLTYPDKEVLKKKFSLGAEEFFPSDGYILLEPEGNIEYSKKLRVEVEIDANSESIAGILGFENYIGNFEYNIVFVPNASLNLPNIRHQKTPDGYFELLWDKPNVQQYTVDRYEITYQDYTTLTQRTVIITDIDKLSIVDKGAVYGYVSYKIKTFFKEEIREPWTDVYTTVIAYPENAIKFEYTGSNSARISWPKNEYNCKYAFGVGYYGNVVYSGNENSIEIKDLHTFLGGIGSWSFPIDDLWVELYVLPDNVSIVSRQYSMYFGKLNSPFVPHLESKFENTAPTFDISKNIVFFMTDKDIWSYNSQSAKPLNNINHQLAAYSFSNLSYSDKSSTLLLSTIDGIMSCDYNLSSFSKLDLRSTKKLENNSAILANNDVVFATIDRSLDNNIESELVAYNLKTKDSITSVILPNKWMQKTISSDGKFICLYNDLGIMVYEFTGSTFIKKYSEQFQQIGGGGYVSVYCYFNKKESSQLLVQTQPYYSNAELYTVDMETQAKTAKIRATYIYSDPFTGNILYHAYRSNKPTLLTISNPGMDKVLTTLEGNGTYLIDNILYTKNLGNGLYYMDITKYLK